MTSTRPVLTVRLTGRAQTAFKQLSEEARATYADCIKALRERFEPASKKELYLAEFQTRSKRANEGWAAFAEDLKVLADKSFSSATQRRQGATSPQSLPNTTD